MTDSSGKVTRLPAHGPYCHPAELAAAEGALDRARQSTVSIRVVRGLVDVLERQGVPRATFLHWATLGPATLDSADARVTRAKVFELCELAIDMSADPALGLHWAENPTGCAFNPISDLIAHAPTLRDGLEALCEFHPLVSDDASFQLCEAAERVSVLCLPLNGASQRMLRFVSEMRMAGLFQLLRSFNSEARLERATFAYAAPSYRSEYARVFAGAECFEQPLTGIEFNRALMDTPSPHKDEELREALRALSERKLLRLRQAPFALRVRELLLTKRSVGEVDMASVARALGLSERSLRRRLVAEGVSYAAIANDALALVAKQCLVDERRTIQETAYEMGFSDRSAFHRAFKSWTGTTPDAFRSSRSG